jgi:hypothetical protein
MDTNEKPTFKVHLCGASKIAKRLNALAIAAAKEGFTLEILTEEHAADADVSFLVAGGSLAEGVHRSNKLRPRTA